MSYLEQPVLLAELDSLLPAVVTFVQVSSDAAEFNQLMLLQHLGQGDVVKVVEGVDGGPQPLVVLLLDQEVVQGIVYRLESRRED